MHLLLGLYLQSSAGRASKMQLPVSSVNNKQGQIKCMGYGFPLRPSLEWAVEKLGVAHAVKDMRLKVAERWP